MATIVYIDGFNFYYGAVKGTPHKWLDYQALCRRLLPRDEIVKIRYFTARISSRPGDPQQAARQDTFLRALDTSPLIEIHYGHYITRRTRMPLATPPTNGPRTVEVLRTEEKGSDVNLAAHLLHDAYRQGCRKALVVSNDSDLAEPIRLAVADGAVVGVVNPHRQSRVSRHLRDVASFNLQLRHKILGSCQLPNPVIDADGKRIHKPRNW